MNNRIPAFYGRQSVDKKDSISIESQFEFCQYELRGEACKEYTDKGYSGKNTDRPRFQELVRDIERGLISKVIVYKLDRISRSIIDFAGMMELFSRYNVEFVSATEKFDTSTPMGRAMLNICIVFAQLERETIQKRVTDAYYSRCQRGFHMSGKAPYGYELADTVMEGIRTKMLVADKNAENVRLMFEMYADPLTSFGDIARYFADKHGEEFSRATISQILRNPSYVQAGLDVYEFFKAQGSAIVNDAADFSGTNGCYLIKGRDVTDNKLYILRDQLLVIAPHEGLISSDLWLRVRKRMMSNTKIANGVSKKAIRTWLAGKIKCGRCGSALTSIQSPNASRFFYCRKRTEIKACEGCGTLRVHEVEASVYGQMCRKMEEFKTVSRGDPEKANPKLTSLRVELAQVENEIEALLKTLTGANATLLNYANRMIEELDGRKQAILLAIADMDAGAVSSDKIDRISDYLDDWENTDFNERRLVIDGLISSIHATSDNLKITWKI